MDMETGNTPSGTDGLTEAEAVERLSAIFTTREEPREDSAETTSAAPEEVESTTEEHADTHSEEVEVTTEGEQDAEAPEDNTTTLSDDHEVEFEGNKVSFAELKKGYLRQANFTQKTQALAEERNAFVAQREQVASQLQAHILQERQILAGVLQEMAPAAPDESLLADAPGEYQRQRVQWEKHQAKLAAVHKDIVARQQASQQEALRAHKAAQEQATAKFAELHPELKGNDAELGAMWQYGLSVFSAEELQSVADARMLSVLRKAQLYDRMKAQEGKVKQVVDSKPALAKPGAPGTLRNSKGEELAKAKARLAKTGSIDDAVRVLSLSNRK